MKSLEDRFCESFGIPLALLESDPQASEAYLYYEKSMKEAAERFSKEIILGTSCKTPTGILAADAP